WEVVFSMGSVFTLCLEIGLPFLIWYPRWRGILIIGGVMLHTGIALSMGLIAFSILMIVMLASFIPPETIKGAVAWLLRTKGHGWLLFNSRAAAGGAALAGVVKAVDLYDQVQLIDVSAQQRAEPEGVAVPARLSEPQLVVDGQTLTGQPMRARLAKML